MPPLMTPSEVVRLVVQHSGLSYGEVADRIKEHYADSKYHISESVLRKLMSPEAHRQRSPRPEQFEAIMAVTGCFPKQVAASFIREDQNPAIRRFEYYPDILPPFNLDIHIAVHVGAKIPSAVLYQLLPTGVALTKPDSDTASIMLILQSFKEVHSGAHADFILQSPVLFKGAEYLFLHDYFVASTAVNVAVRELYGYPAKIGEPKFTEDQQRAELTIAGLPILSVDIKGKTNPKKSKSDTSDMVLDRKAYRSLVRKRILNPDGKSYAVDQLISYCSFDEPESGYVSRTHRASLSFQCDSWRLRFSLEDQPAVPCVVKRNMSRILSAGRIEHDYLKDGPLFTQ